MDKNNQVALLFKLMYNFFKYFKKICRILNKLSFSLSLGHNGDVKSTRIRSNGINSSTTGTLLSDKHKLGGNNYKYYSDLSEISGGILGTIPEKVKSCIRGSFNKTHSISFDN